ncbi:MAG: O-antigen ligase family protein [Saprospiraceae bacterium]|nr:O-antigen ligase family protein [Saprospiraceae bacterium]
MRQKQPVPTIDQFHPWRVSLWLILLGGMLFLWPSCLDRYLAPRFFFLSLALLVSLWFLRDELKKQVGWPLHLFDTLLLGWYGWNLLSISWSLSFSEGIFYAQKTLLLFAVYWFVRHALQQDATQMEQTFKQVFTVLTWVFCGVLAIQLSLAWWNSGIDNEQLYDTVSGLSGNKNLASAFLFFLLAFQVMFFTNGALTIRRWAPVGMLLALILLLQVRTVYLAFGAFAMLYTFGRAAIEPAFKQVVIRKLLPAGIALLVIGAALAAWKGSGSSLVQRLNPLTYLESQTANERRFVWYKTDLLNKEHPILGVGNGSWKFWFPSKGLEGGYRMEEKNVVFTRAHNDYLEVQAEMGWVGVLWFCSLFGLALFYGISAIRNKNLDLEQRRQCLAASAALLGYCVIQFFDFPRERIEFQIILGFLFAWLVHFGARTGVRLVAPKVAMITIIGFGLLFNLLIGWNRMNGEIHTIKLLTAQNKGNWRVLTQESQAAENLFYEYTDVAVPIAWHEGIGWYQQRQMDKAVSAFEKAYKLNPWSFQVMNNYASALVQTNRLREAIAMYELTVQINPSFDDGKFNLAYVHEQLGEYDQALRWVNSIDTIANPGNQQDRDANRRTLAKQTEFKKTLLEKMK